MGSMLMTVSEGEGSLGVAGTHVAFLALFKNTSLTPSLTLRRDHRILVSLQNNFYNQQFPNVFRIELLSIGRHFEWICTLKHLREKLTGKLLVSGTGVGLITVITSLKELLGMLLI